MKSQNLWIQVQEKNIALFVNTGALMHDIEIPAQKRHAHNRAPYSPIEQKCHFSQAPCSIKVCFDYENNDKLHRMTTQIVHNNIVFMLIIEWTN